MDERTYDMIHNEGGEGYNPYRAERECKEFEAHQSWLQTREGRKDSIIRALDAKDCSLARECGTYDKTEIDTLRAELAQIEAEEAVEFAAVWTLDITKERRTKWNSRVRAGEFNDGNRIDPRKVGAAENAQGWNFAELKKAVKYHNL